MGMSDRELGAILVEMQESRPHILEEKFDHYKDIAIKHEEAEILLEIFRNNSGNQFTFYHSETLDEMANSAMGELLGRILNYEKLSFEQYCKWLDISDYSYFDGSVNQMLGQVLEKQIDGKAGSISVEKIRDLIQKIRFDVNKHFQFCKDAAIEHQSPQILLDIANKNTRLVWDGREEVKRPINIDTTVKVNRAMEELLEAAYWSKTLSPEEFSQWKAVKRDAELFSEEIANKLSAMLEKHTSTQGGSHLDGAYNECLRRSSSSWEPLQVCSEKCVEYLKSGFQTPMPTPKEWHNAITFWKAERFDDILENMADSSEIPKQARKESRRALTDLHTKDTMEIIKYCDKKFINGRKLNVFTTPDAKMKKLAWDVNRARRFRQKIV